MRSLVITFLISILGTFVLATEPAHAACMPVFDPTSSAIGGGPLQPSDYRDSETNEQCTPTPEERKTAESIGGWPKGSTNACDSWWKPLVKPIDCFLAPGIVWFFGGVLMGASGMVLEFAGYLFDLLVSAFVVGFATTLGGLGMVEGIHTGWTVLRDISNIVIIGMFTFIAISIIIGNHTFGEKKLVAKVLVVAILINFSLLFAKIIIDASNFVAWQVYKSMAPSGSGGGGVGGLARYAAEGTGANISGKFLKLTNATSLFKITSDSIQANTETGYAATNFLGWSTLKGVAKGLFFALVASILLLAAAGVLLFGCYLIAARGLLLVFLMIVSALAFASYLVPQLSDGEYGWKTWWKSLINASIFGPLLMMLLYVSLVILSPISQKVQGGSFANVLSDPSAMQRAGNDWQVIIVFIFGIGMLYASLKVANSFAGKIAGFSTASMLTGVPVIGAARLTGLVGRSSVGRWSANKHEELQKITDKTKAQEYAARALNWMKKGTYDFSKQSGMASALSKLNAPKFGDSWGKGGYVGVKKRQSDDAGHIAAENTEKPSAAADRAEKEKREELAEKIRGEIAKNTREVGKSREQAKEIARASVDEQRVLAHEMKRATQEAVRSVPGSGDVSRGTPSQKSTSEERERVSGEVKSRIGRAQEEATAKAVEQSLGTDIKSLQEQLHALEHASLESLPDHLKKEIKAVRKANYDAAHHAEEDFAKSVAQFTPGMLLGDKRAVEGVADALKAHAKKDQWKDVIAGVKKELEGSGGHGGASHAETKAAAAPAAHPPAAKGGGDHH